jgi:hypothetical protein
MGRGTPKAWVKPERRYPEPSSMPRARATMVLTLALPPVAAPKLDLLRSEPYRRFVASHACFACDIEGLSQAAHPNQAKYGKGGHIKAGDQFCFPLCSQRPGHMGCHYAHDNCVDVSKDERDLIEDGYVIRMERIARAASRPEFREAA